MECHWLWKPVVFEQRVFQGSRARLWIGVGGADQRPCEFGKGR